MPPSLPSRRRSASAATGSASCTGSNWGASTPASRSAATRNRRRNSPIVGIDDDTFSELKLQWPFPRRLHAKVIDRLVEDGAKAIAFDVQFTEATDPRDDNALVEAVHRAGNVVLATSEVSAQGKHAIFGGNAVLRQIGARAGNTVYIPDSDGTVRRFPYALQNLESFAVASRRSGEGRIRRRRRLRRARWRRLDRLRGTAEDDPHLLLRRRPLRPGQPGSVQGQDRRRRRHLAGPPGRQADPVRRRTDVGLPRSRRTRSRPSSTASRCAPPRAGSTSP